MSDLMSVPEAAEEKGVNESAVRLAILTGRLKGRKVGRNYVIRRSDLAAWELRRRGPKKKEEG